MITVENLCFDYPGKRALNNISFTIPTNSITALVGPNGAGKTTLLRCVAALEDFTSGKIVIEQDTEKYKVEEEPRKIHKITSYLSDFFGLYEDLTVSQCLTYLAWSKGCPPHLVANQIEIAAQKLQLEAYLSIKASKLSRGLRQRLAIAQSIVQEPKILLLDEPASGLDPQARYDLSKLLLELQTHGLTILVSSHILSELEDYSTHMIVIDHGKILDHRPLIQDGSKPPQSMQSIYLELMQRNNTHDHQS